MKMTSENQATLNLLQRVFTGALEIQDGFAKIPSDLFVPDVGLHLPPLPEVEFYEMELGKPKLLRRADQPYSALALSNLEIIYIKEEDLLKIQDYAAKRMASMERENLSEEMVEKQKRMEALRKSAILVVEDLFEHPTPENIKRSTRVVSSFVYVLMRDPSAYLLLSTLSSHDPYTLQHSVGAAINCIILAKKIGINSEKELNDVGLAGLLHDLGKVKVDKAIINNRGPLSPDQWDKMKEHPVLGYEIVKDHPSLSERTKRAILEHHEDRHGEGYPYRTPYKDLDIFSKITAISDVYNALTTDRTYSKARTPFDALQLMRKDLWHKLDPHLFEEMVKIFGGNFK